MTDYATLLQDEVALEYHSIDRIFIQGYVPQLQTQGLVCRFLRWQRGFVIPSSAAFGQIGRAYVTEIHRWAKAQHIPIRYFKKGENKEQIARPLIDAAATKGGDGRVVLVGIAQEKASIWRSRKAKGQEHVAHPHMEWDRQMAFINHFYFYLWDPEFGPAFWKTNAYAPYPIWIYLNGHEWAKRQLEKLGIGYTALDNGFRSCDDPAALQSVCDHLEADDVGRFFWRWCPRLPSPFTWDERRTTYAYELAMRQFEVSDTRVFRQPRAGRAFFEGLIRDHLDIGRPNNVVLLFNRKLTARTPGKFSTKVITRGVDPQLSCVYKSSRLKQYFKEDRALRTETVIGDTRDFRIGRRVDRQNWQALRAIGENANRRLCETEAADASPAPDVVTFHHVTRPSLTADGQRAPGLRFGDPRVMALFAALVGFTHILAGFTNSQLVQLVVPLLDAPYTSRQATYDLRRLRRKGLIERVPYSQRYQLTPLGRTVAVLFSKTYGRVLCPGFVMLDLTPHDIPARHPLQIAWRHLDHALDAFVDKQMIAAA